MKFLVSKRWLTPSTLCSFLKIRVNSRITCLFFSSCTGTPLAGVISVTFNRLVEYTERLVSCQQGEVRFTDYLHLAASLQVGIEAIHNLAPTATILVSGVLAREAFMRENELRLGFTNAQELNGDLRRLHVGRRGNPGKRELRRPFKNRELAFVLVRFVGISHYDQE